MRCNEVAELANFTNQSNRRLAERGRSPTDLDPSWDFIQRDSVLLLMEMEFLDV